MRNPRERNVNALTKRRKPDKSKHKTNRLFTTSDLWCWMYWKFRVDLKDYCTYIDSGFPTRRNLLIVYNS